MTDLTIATWNVLYRDRDTRLPLLTDRVLAIKPDVLLLQETNTAHAHALADATGMTVACVAPEDPEGPGVQPAVLTATASVSADVHTLSTRPGVYRHYAYAVVDIAGSRVRVSTTHLQHTVLAGRMGIDQSYAAVARGDITLDQIADDEIRVSVGRRLDELEQIETIRGQLEHLPEIFCGDLNFVPRGPEYQRILSWGMTDAWASGPRLGSGATILGANPLIADGPHAYDHDAADQLPGHTGLLDYILDFQFHTPELRADHAWTFGAADDLGRWPSDHLGLAVKYSHCGPERGSDD